LQLLFLTTKKLEKGEKIKILFSLKDFFAMETDWTRTKHGRDTD